MNISIPYRTGHLNLEIPEKRVADVLEPKRVYSASAPDRLLRETLAVSESSGASFSDFLTGTGGLLVIVNDATRPTPTRAVLETLADELDAAGASFIVATGAHRAPGEEELKFIFGNTLARFQSRISAHDARRDECFLFGTTSRGTRVRLNTKVRQAGRLLVIGSVEPHYFAGYTGGRKGLIPGLSAFDTIEQNHKLALLPEAQTLALDGNPVHEDMLEACRMLDKNVYSIMTVLDREQHIYAVTAGDLYTAFGSAVHKAQDVFIVPLKRKAPLVIACAKYPMDIDLYQSQKAIENAKLALRPGGTLILVSSCRDGIGDDSFCRLLTSCDSPEAVYERIAEGYKLGYHKAAKIAEVCGKAKVMAFTELPPEALKKIFIEPVSNLQKTVGEALSEPGAEVIILPDASVTVPAVTGAVSI